MKRKLFTLFVLFALLLAGMPVLPARAGGATMFVDADSNCVSSCGGTWATAFPTLQTALEGAAVGAVYWVAEGVYYPDEGSNQVNNSRTSTYALMNGVQIYGGFNGTETLLSQRNVSANPTILSGDVDGNDVNTDGDFVADSVADIVGNNAYHVVTGSGTDNTAILDGFTITAGLANGTSPHDQGGGIYNSGGSPWLSNLYITSNRADIGGGMRNVSGNANLNEITFSVNEADFGGGMANWGSAPLMYFTTFGGNVAVTGGGMHNWNSSPSMSHSSFIANEAVIGGGMYNASSSNPTMSMISIHNNTASNNGGGIYNENSNPSLTDVNFYNNKAPNNKGGGMFNTNSAVLLTNVTFDLNHAGHGGGIYSENLSVLTMNFVTFGGNTAALYGGGMYSYNSDLSLKNITFSSNTALRGGGMYNSSNNPNLTNVTFSDNSASNTGGGIYNYNSHPVLVNTIVANSVSGGDCINHGGSSINTLSAHNLIEDGARACGLINNDNGNVIGVDPKLDLLANNGGSTDTHALLPNSPAIDAGDNTICPPTDQRGITRPQGSKCDIGSYELEQSSKVFRSTGANDGWVLESGENTSKGGSKDNEAAVFRLGDGEVDKQYRAILSFNTDSLPDNAIITHIIIKIKEQGISGTNPFTILGGLKVDMQKPFFGANLGLAIADFEAAAGKNAVATFGANATNDWYSAVLNAAGKAFVNKTGVTQFRLRFATDDNNNNASDYMKFFSGNHSVTADRPTLIIKYYVP